MYFYFYTFKTLLIYSTLAALNKNNQYDIIDEENILKKKGEKMNNFKKYIAKSISLKLAIVIIFSFSLFYFLINLRFINLLVTENIKVSPFNYSYFKFNIFNMDPSQLGDLTSTNFMHPLFCFIQLIISPFKTSKYGLYVILLIQSLINSINVVLIYIYCSNLKIKKSLALLLSIFFGFFSYSINSALVPDSYIYAQNILIISLVYMQYCKISKNYGIIGHAILGVLNFSVTVSNVASYALAIIINKSEKETKTWIKKIIQSIIIALGIIIVLGIIQQLLFKSNFTDNIFNSVNNGGLNYSMPFNLKANWKIIYLMFTAPIITAPLRVMPELQAIVTNIGIKFPIYLKLITVILLILIIMSIIYNIKNREMWTLSSFLIVAFFIHIIKGFGLAVFEYDMYLYAGHYIFVVPMYLGFLFKKLENKKILKFVTIILAIITLVTFINNIFMQNQMFNLVKQTYL